MLWSAYPAEDLHQDVADHLEAMRADLVDGVHVRVPVGVVGAVLEIDEVQCRNAAPEKRHVIIRNRSAGGGEILAISAVGGCSPDIAPKLSGRVPLLQDV